MIKGLKELKSPAFWIALRVLGFMIGDRFCLRFRLGVIFSLSFVVVKLPKNLTVTSSEYFG